MLTIGATGEGGGDRGDKGVWEDGGGEWGFGGIMRENKVNF